MQQLLDQLGNRQAATKELKGLTPDESLELVCTDIAHDLARIGARLALLIPGNPLRRRGLVGAVGNWNRINRRAASL
jgi:hypothetical protein